MRRAGTGMILVGFIGTMVCCANYPEQLTVKDTLGISKTISDVMKKKFGLFVPVNSKVTSTDDFFNSTLVLLWDTDGHMDMKITMLEMEKTHRFLFRDVIFLDSMCDEEASSSTMDTPFAKKNDTLMSIDDGLLPRVRITYNNTDMDKIFEHNLAAENNVFVMSRVYAKRYSHRLKELIFE